jgi:ribonuclease P protein component
MGIPQNARNNSPRRGRSGRDWLCRLAPPHEAHLAAEEAQAGTDPWVPRSDAHPRRPGCDPPPPPQGPQAPGAVTDPMADRKKRGRLSRSGDFDRVYRDGRSHANRYLVLYAFPRAEQEGADGVRLGISVSRKVGGAVERNAVKRALREAFWELDERLAPDHDFVIVARPDSAGLVEREGTKGVRVALAELLAESGLQAA